MRELAFNKVERQLDIANSERGDMFEIAEGNFGDNLTMLFETVHLRYQYDQKQRERKSWIRSKKAERSEGRFTFLFEQQLSGMRKGYQASDSHQNHILDCYEKEILLTLYNMGKAITNINNRHRGIFISIDGKDLSTVSHPMSPRPSVERANVAMAESRYVAHSRRQRRSGSSSRSGSSRAGDRGRRRTSMSRYRTSPRPPMTLAVSTCRAPSYSLAHKPAP